MPVRTHRGRAAAYRRAWGWPLRSPRHLAGTAAVLSVLVIGLSVLLPALSSSNPGRSQRAGAEASGHQLPPTTTRDPISSRVSPPPSSGPPPSTAMAPVPAGTTAPVAPAQGAVPAEALATADAFARACVRHPPGMTAAAWAEQMRPYTSEEFWPQLGTVDPGSVPSGTVTGPPVAVAGSGPTAADIDVPTDALVLRITVIRTPVGWRVVGYDQAGG